MKEQIEDLIQEHKLRKEECFEHLEQLSHLLDTKISEEEKEVLRTSVFYLEQEHHLRSLFISDLENLIV